MLRHVFTAIILSFALLPVSAFACLGPMSEYSLFFETIPAPRPHADLVARVVLLEAEIGTATARIEEVLETSNDAIHPGDNLTLAYTFTSCGPNHKKGDKGIILANVKGDDKNLVAYPFSRRFGDGKLMAPIIE